MDVSIPVEQIVELGEDDGEDYVKKCWFGDENNSFFPTEEVFKQAIPCFKDMATYDKYSKIQPSRAYCAWEIPSLGYMWYISFGIVS